jgi:hypothetical protein
MFIGGTQTGSDYADSINYTSSSGIAYYLGVSSFNTFPVTAYVGPFRMTKGAGRYTATFTPPSTFFPTS